MLLKKDNKVISSVKQVESDEEIDIRLSDGDIKAIVK